ncbi:MAG: outer membrane beta-barrel protein [Candidatus Methylacidiphilaceae bacterium]
MNRNLCGKGIVWSLGLLLFPLSPLRAADEAPTEGSAQELSAGSAGMGSIQGSPEEMERLQKVLEEQGIAAMQAQNPGIKLSGYVEASYTYNLVNAPSFNHVPVIAANPAISGVPRGTPLPSYPGMPLRFTTDGIPGGSFNFNQLKVALEKALTDENKWQAGFRVDAIFGQDAALGEPDAVTGNGSFTNTGIGFNSSGIFLEQAYVQFKMPIGDKSIEFHIGQYASPIGLEVMERPANFNFSYGILFNNFEPFTMVGGEAIYKFNDCWTTRLGVTNGGWNVSRSGYPYYGMVNNMINNSDSVVIWNMYDYVSKDKLFLNTFGYAVAPNGVNPPGFGTRPFGTYAGAYDPGGDIVPSPYNDNGLFMEFNDFGTWIPKWVKDQKLQFAYELVGGFSNAAVLPAGLPQMGGSTLGSLGVFPTTGLPPGGYNGSTSFFGVSIYQIYKFNKLFSMAWREQYDHTNYNQIFTNFLFPADIWDVTVDWRFDLADNFMIRVENRMDYGKGFMSYYSPAAGFAPTSGNGLAALSNGPFWFFALDVVYSY